MTLNKILAIITIITIVISIIITEFDNQTKENKLENRNEEIERLKEQNKQLKKSLNDSHVVDPNIFTNQGISKSLANRYYLIYTQLDILLSTAGLSISGQKWLKSRMEEGVLHHVLKKYSIHGLDTSVNPPEIATAFVVVIDWEKCQMFSRLKSDVRDEKSDVYDENTLKLAASFAEIVKRNNFLQKSRIQTVSTPSVNSLVTLKILEGFDSDISKSDTKFKEYVNETLHLSSVDSDKWREGIEKKFIIGSRITPELQVGLIYIEKTPKKNNEE